MVEHMSKVFAHLEVNVRNYQVEKPILIRLAPSLVPRPRLFFFFGAGEGEYLLPCSLDQA